MKLKHYLLEKITWKQSGDSAVPYNTVHDGVAMKVRVNDFPADHLYTLLSNGSSISFDDWPAGWKRPVTTSPAGRAASATGSRVNGTRPARASDHRAVRSVTGTARPVARASGKKII
jgi:hypothetical protein